MSVISDLPEMVKERRLELERLQNQGAKIIGYVPAGFIPEELIWASGAVPVGLNCGGGADAVLKSIEFIPRFFDTYSRSQIGYWAIGEPLYKMVDLVVVPSTDKNIAAIADCWEMWTNTRCLRLGIPHNNLTKHAFGYYLDGLRILKDELERLTGTSINEDRFKEEIELGNRIRVLLRRINETRKAKTAPISGSDFVKLHHASFILDRRVFVEYLESVLTKMEEVSGKAGPRVFVIGSTIAEGDYKIYELLENAGAQVVAEDFSEGMRPYQQDVSLEGEPLTALAETYFRDKTPVPAFFRPSVDRIPTLFKVGDEFGVSGILWYSLMYREAYEIEGIHFGRMVEKKGLPYIRLLSDYDRSEYELYRTRIEAFIETMNHY